MVPPFPVTVVLIIVGWLLVAVLLDKGTDAIWKRIKPRFKRKA